MVAPELKARVDQIHRDLDRYTYYQLLNLEPNAAADDVRRAFHRMAGTLHPDRYQASADVDLRQKVYAIYKRIAEGYRVLMDHQTRREYDEGLQQGQRRLVKTDRQKVGPKRSADAIANPQARKYFTMAQEAERRGDNKNALMYCKLAANLAGDDPLIQERLAALASKTAS